MTKWLAKYKNDARQEVWPTEVEKDSKGQYFWLDERGFPRPFEGEFDHPTLGHLTLSGTPVAVLEEPPVPPDHKHNKAVGEFLDVLNKSFASNEMRIQFENDHAEIVRAMNAKPMFKGISLEQMAAWKVLIREATAAPSFTQSELRLLFTGKTIGPHLYIAEQTIPSVPQTEYNGTYRVECHGCRKLKGYEIRQLEVLKMRAGLSPMFKCGNPCERLMR